jgi:hypothetical protein
MDIATSPLVGLPIEIVIVIDHLWYGCDFVLEMIIFCIDDQLLGIFSGTMGNNHDKHHID